MKKTRVIRIAGGRQCRIRVVFEGRRKLEREFPFCPWLLEKTSIRVEGHRRPNNRVESNLTRGVCCLISFPVLQKDIPPLVYIATPQAGAIIEAAAYS
jgi:hypothetical protein